MAPPGCKLWSLYPFWMTATITQKARIHTHTHIYTGWNDKIVTREKTTWFHFLLMKTGFLFLLQTIYLLASCVQIPRVIRAFYHVWNWNNVQRARSDMCHHTTHALYRSKLWQQDYWQHPQNANLDGSTCPGWWKQSFRLRLLSLVWFQVRATSCYLTSSKSGWKSTPKCTWMCWRVWWSPGAIRWPLADPGCGSRTRRWPTSPGRPSHGFRSECYDFVPFSHWPPSSPGPEPAGLLCLVIRREHHQHDLPQHQNQSDHRHLVSIRRAPASACGKGMLPVPDPYRGVLLRLKAATLNRCQLYYIIKLAELIFSIKFLK